jgi:sugar phosphate isomerase/epimerase
MSQYSRREFVKQAAVGAATLPMLPSRVFAEAMKSPFRVAVISDEITQDFEHALQIITNEFGLQWVEVREMWNKNVLKMDRNEIAEAHRLLNKYKVRVTDIASPLFKVDWPDAPRSKFSPKRDQFGADFDFKQQDEVLERSIEIAKTFNTDRVRCFDFWRLDDVTPHRAAINAKLLAASKTAGEKGITLLLENEYACNTATTAEAARVLKSVQSPYLKLNWDPGNAAKRGEKQFPEAYKLLPKNRIGHCHCKDVQRKPGTEGNDIVDQFDWAPMGGGLIDWAGIFHALKRDGYHFAVSLETHWRGAGTPEESTRQSMAGMKRLLKKAGAAA